MDELTSVLDRPRAVGAFVVRSVLTPPWGIRVEDHAPITVVAVLRGACWVRFADGAVAVAGPGDVAIVRGDEAYEVADAADTPAQIVIHPDNRCTTLDGVDLKDAMTMGTRTWGTGDHAHATVMLTGAYPLGGGTDRRLLDALPRSILLPAAQVAAPIVDLLAAEIDKDLPGQQAVLDRLVDLLLISSLRTWFDEAGDRAPRWYRAHFDPVVGPALRLVHAHPETAWSVEGLAASVGSSRAAFARRFHDLVGLPPMQYVTEWRISLAASAMREHSLGLSEIAAQVGYATPYALSTAFKRVRGISPAEFRRRLAV